MLMESEFLELRTRVRIGIWKKKLSRGRRMCSCRMRRVGHSIRIYPSPDQVDLQVCFFGSWNCKRMMVRDLYYGSDLYYISL
jgi:hypothetical protein